MSMDLKGSRVLVIGGAGFVGSHLVDHLLQEPVREIVVLDNFVRGTRANLQGALTDRRVRVQEGSITDVPLLHELMRDTDDVCHLAALWLYECMHQPRAAMDVNVMGTYNVIEAAQQAGVKKLVFSSSASVYGESLFTPMTEDHPFNNRTVYGATKIAGEQCLRAFYEQHGLNYLALRYMNVYGPRMDDKGSYVSVIIKALDRIERGLPPIIFGDGSQAYDFIAVQDVARANLLALTSEATDACLNVGTGVRTTINDVVHLLLKLSGVDVEPEYRPQTSSLVTHRVGSTDKAERLLGFKASVPLEEGLKELIAWRGQRVAV